MFYLSVLAQFKNETMNMKLWIEHYLWQGVQHFYLIDNNSDDDPLSVLQEYIDRGVVSYFFRPAPCSQVQNYQDIFVNCIRGNSFWVAVVDLDEFIYGVDHALVSKLKAFEYYNVIYMNWFVFGTSGCVDHPKDVRLSNVHRMPDMDPVNTKYIFKASAIKDPSQIWIHWLLFPNSGHKIESGRKVWVANRLIRIHHYVCQSIEFFEKVKSVRGDATHTNHKWTRAFFDAHNDPATHLDETLKHLVIEPPADY